MGHVKSRYVGQTEFKKLYHYENFKAEHLSAMLRDMRIHCSNPANFNDPWDCDPWFDDKGLEDPRVLQDLLDHQLRNFPDGLTPTQRQLYEHKLRSRSYERVNLLAGYSEENIATIRKRRIYCLTPFPDLTLMWSHYAEKHKGICLEFGIDNPLLRMALEVLYPEKYPVWLPHQFENDHDSAIEMILTKAEPWKYEREFRIISSYNNDKDTAGALYVENDCFALPPNALQSVIAGCNADYDAVKAIVKAHMPSLLVKRAIRIQTQFNLEILAENEL